MDDDDFDRIQGDFRRAAQLVKRAGFDAVELHCGHGYLLSQFICPHTNRRRDRYGGSIQNRLRYDLFLLNAFALRALLWLTFVGIGSQLRSFAQFEMRSVMIFLFS